MQTSKRGFIAYLRHAFFFHWNLLAFSAALAGGLISGAADIVLPLAAAAELAYLAAVSTHPRFQRWVDALALPPPAPEHSDQKVQELLARLSPHDRQNFESLKAVCDKLRRVAQEVRGESPNMSGSGVSELQISGVNRLLWIYLKLLYLRNSMDAFFKTITEKDINADIHRTRTRLEQLGTQTDDNPAQSKRRQSLEDTLTTSRQRLENYRRVKENYDFIGLELERLYSKITHLAEMGISRQDSDLITHEIDVVSISVRQTEKAMSDLDFLSGALLSDQDPPRLIGNKTAERD